jgi:hypothetical protein
MSSAGEAACWARGRRAGEPWNPPVMWGHFSIIILKIIIIIIH